MPEGESPGQLAASGDKSSGKVCTCSTCRVWVGNHVFRALSTLTHKFGPQVDRVLVQLGVSNQVDPLPLEFLGQA